MPSDLRRYLFTAICKAMKRNTALTSLPLSLNQIFTSDVNGSKFILKISKNSLCSLLDVRDGPDISSLKKENDVIEDIRMDQHSGDAYYTFSVNRDHFISRVLSPSKEPFVSSNDRSTRERVIVEYSSPNIAKPFHMGHLRSTVIGQFVANVLSKSHDVVKINYLGDWGTQFGLVQAGLENMSINIDNIKENPLSVINRAYINANQDDKLREYAKQIVRNLEKNRNAEELNMWKKLREMTVKHLRDTYKILGVEFDQYTWESHYVKGFTPVLQTLKDKCLVEEVGGQLVVLSEEKRIPLMKSDGTSLYLSRDIMAALDRYNRFQVSSMKYVIDKSQQDHVEALRSVVRHLTGRDVIEHVKFGKIIGMSTRKGTSVFLSDILDQATQLMAHNQNKSPNTRDTSWETTQTLAVTALVVYLLKHRRTKDFTFNWDLALQSKGDTGVKLQYTHSRLWSLEQNCGVQVPTDCCPHLISEPDAFKLIALLDSYEGVWKSSEEDLESSYLINYLFKLCNTTSVCLKKLPVKGENTDLAQQRLLMFHKTRKVLKSAMLVLGIKPLVSM